MKKAYYGPFAGFPMNHLLTLMEKVPMRRAMRKAYEEWRSAQGTLFQGGVVS